VNLLDVVENFSGVVMGDPVQRIDQYLIYDLHESGRKRNA
jgi:hypothetical protein